MEIIPNDICELCNKNEANCNLNGVLLCPICFEEEKLNKKDNVLSFITDNIILGSSFEATCQEKLKDLNVSNILICGKELIYHNNNIFIYKKLNLRDTKEEDLIAFLYDAFSFIDSSKNAIYIYCKKGISRSSSIVIGYLIYKNKLKYIDAFNYVKSNRKIINPNTNFIEQLKMLEKFLDLNDYDIYSLKNMNYILMKNWIQKLYN